MVKEPMDGGYGFTVFRPETPTAVKLRKIVFFIIFSLIILIQACYWLFANSVEPILVGMPFGMFFIAMFISIEFLALLVLYLIESKEIED
jgi:phosphoglycerol transferase MdoB-like AlkP superfamily enzyme